MTSIPPTYSINAYTAPRVADASRPSASPEARAAAATDQVELSSRPASPVDRPVERLVAARVNTPVDFAPQARPTAQATGSLNIYHHPADRNAAAVGVDLGRQLDVRG